MKKECYPKISSIRQMMENAVATQPAAIAYRFSISNGIRDVTVQEFYDSIESLGAYLTEMGFGKSHIACVGNNCYPWIQAFVCTLMSAGVFVPIDKELPTDQILYLLKDSESEVVFCSEKYESKIAEHRDELPNLKKIICFERKTHDGDFLSMEQCIEEGNHLNRQKYDALRSDENDLKYLVYTSGTTGVAKGVMLTEHNIVSGIYYGVQVSQIHGTGLSVLPYNHTYEAVCDILVSLYIHVTVCINDSLMHVQNNLKLFKPNHIYLVPAFSEHFYNQIQKNIRKQKKEKIFGVLIKISNGLRKFGIDLRRLFFAPVLKEFGGNLTRMVCGGAPIRPEIGKYFDSIGITLTGGYGITECSPLVSVNDLKDNNFNSAGHRIGCLEWKIDSPDENGIGEICVKGDVVMNGYYKRPDLTAEVLRDGWFYTGDYGYINERDEIVITGRKKNIIILSNGKNIYPEELEEMVMRVPYVTEAVVKSTKNDFGEDLSLTAEIYAEEGLGDRTEKTVLKDIREQMKELPCYKQIGSVIIRKDPFDKTTTHKIKRAY